MRTFIAIELPQQIKNKLAELQALLKQTGADVKWVAPQNIHLTLKFLGDIDVAKSAKITAIIEEITRSSKQFPISLSLLGAFPKIEFPRIIWVAIEKGDKEVKVLAEKLEERLAKLGIPKEERNFSSHITIGRVRSLLNKDKLVMALKEAESYCAGKNIEFTATRITLLKSTLSPTGPFYEALQEASISAA